MHSLVCYFLLYELYDLSFHRLLWKVPWSFWRCNLILRSGCVKVSGDPCWSRWRARRWRCGRGRGRGTIEGVTTTTNVGKWKVCGGFTGFPGLIFTNQQPPSPQITSLSHERWVLATIQTYCISFSAGLRSFFKSFFKKNDPIKLYESLKVKIQTRGPGQRLWQDNDVRIDRGQTLEDGSTNIIWQRQAQTKIPALKKITNTHAKIVTQRIYPNHDVRTLEEDFYSRLGWVSHLINPWNSSANWNHSGWSRIYVV